MARTKTEPPRGIVGATSGVAPERFEHQRLLPSARTAPFVEHHWTVAWQMPPGATQERHTLSHPSVHVSLAVGALARVGVTGPTRGRFTWVLSGSGRVVATKFLPGAFRVLLARKTMRELVDVVADLDAVVDARVAGVVGAAFAAVDAAGVDAVVDAVDAAWAAVLPKAPPADQALLLRIVERARDDRSLTRVEQLVDDSGLHIRELQRFCADALGLSPRWLIRRYRLHDALAALDAIKDVGEAGQSLADLAQRLGYADQSHFSRDFKAVVGMSPSTYLRRAR